MSSEYTPNLDAMRMAWGGFRLLGGVPYEEADAEFNRMVKALKAEVWDEGFDAGERDVFEHVTFDEDCIKNPYRKD